MYYKHMQTYINIHMHTVSYNICRTKKQSPHIKVKVRLIEPGWEKQ